MKKLLLLLGTILITSAFFSQTDRMDVNSIDARVTARGVMFYDTTTGAKPGFESLKDSGTSTIYSSSLNFLGLDVINQQIGIMDLYGTDGVSRFSPGPLTIIPGLATVGQREFGAANISALETAKWDKVFCVSKLDVGVFKQWFACKKDPGCNEVLAYPGYVIPQSIMTWPAHGDISKSQDYYLAPFFDKNSDGNYNPADGDFPCIKGDKYCWYIINDKFSNVANTPVGAEIHVEVYAFDKDISNPIDRTIFVGYDIINRSTRTLYGFKVSQFVDFDLGCGNDDYVGSFPNLNSVFAYNGDNNDNYCSGGKLAYGKTPPAQGITVLNRALTGSMYCRNGFVNQGIPTNFVEFGNYQGNFWKNGDTLNYGGDGLAILSGGSSTSGVQTSFMFPDPAPTGMPVWNESSGGNPTGKRKVFANTGNVTFTPGDVYELDLAYVYSRADSGNHLASVAKLKLEIPIVQAFFNDSILPCTDSLTGTLAQKELFKDKVSVFPNPFKQSLQINLEGEQGSVTVELMDAFGNLILRETSSFKSKTISVNHLAKGVYFLKIVNEKQEYFVEKLIKL